MIGSLTNAAASILLTMFVTRTMGDGNRSDIFSLAYSISLMLTTIGMFEVRQFQATDVKEQFSFSDYLSMRYITCFVMMLSAVLFVFLKGYDAYKAFIILIVCLYMMIGALQDVYHGLFQLKGRLDLSGKSLTLRISVSVLTFALSILTISNLTISCISLCVSSMICFALYDLRYAKEFTPQYTKPIITKDKQKKLFIACFPLCTCSFLSMYILNAPKFAIDTFFSDQSGVQTCYSILIMPAAVINLFSIFAFRPAMTPMANSFSNGNLKQFIRILTKLVLWILIATFMCLIVAYFLGIPVLSTIYGIDLSEYKLSLLIILAGGGLSALLGVFQYVITIMRQQYKLLIGYIIASVFAYFISNSLVKSNGILGGAISYMSIYALLVLYFVVLMIFHSKKLEAKNSMSKRGSAVNDEGK